MRVISQFTLQVPWAYYVYSSLETHSKVGFYCQAEVRIYADMGVRIRERGEAIALCAAVVTVTFQRGDRVSTPWLGRASTPGKHNMCSIGDFRGQPGHCL